MKRLRIATKLALAIVPIALVALAAGALVSWTFLEEAEAQERVSYAGAVAENAVDSLLDVSREQGAAIAAALEGGDVGPISDTVDAGLADLTESAQVLARNSSGDASGIAAGIVSDTRRVARSLEQAREGDPLAESTNELYDEMGETLISIVAQSTFYFDDESRQREGAGATALARASFASFQQERLIDRFLGDATTLSDDQLEATLWTLETTVTDWLETADESSPTVTALGLARTQPLDAEEITDLEAFPAPRNDLLVESAADIIARVSASADAAAEDTRTEAITVASVVVGVLFVALVMALVVGRSMVRRVRTVTDAARHVSEVELPKMVEALRNPTGALTATGPAELESGGPDEVGELARSFSALHHTLVDVANQQMEILKRGVSEIFVTLARRNRSLVDRQLALIDELESGEEDPEVLGGYYKLDHLSTRMRRNAESLLVLAGAENPRLWAQPLEMDDVVRAALGEVDDYQRVDVLALEPARVSGRAVTDLSHLMSELLDNATQFSPPTERVRVAGLFDDDGYVLTISDNGVGIPEDKLGELNQLMQRPPVLGLALDPTLGMYVVARLAKRHGIGIKLVPGVPGTTVRITLPRDLLATDDSPPTAPDAEAATPERPALPATGAASPTRSPSPASAVGAPQHPPASPGDPATAGSAEEEARPTTVSVPSQTLKASAHGRHVVERTPAEPAPHRPGSPPPASRPPERSRQETPVPPTSAPPASPSRKSDAPASSPQAGPPARPTDRAPAPPPRPEPGGAPLPRREASGDRTGTGSTPPRPDPSPDGRMTRPIDTPDTAPPLPTRAPGTSFSEDGDAPESSAPSRRGAEGIRDALIGYRLGRDTAVGTDTPPGRPSAPPGRPEEGDTSDE